MDKKTQELLASFQAAMEQGTGGKTVSSQEAALKILMARGVGILTTDDLAGVLQVWETLRKHPYLYTNPQSEVLTDEQQRLLALVCIASAVIKERVRNQS